MTHEEQFKNQNYKRWIRGCLGFKYLGEGLVQTVNTTVKNQHGYYVKNLTPSECDKCCTNTLLPNHAKVDNKCTKGRKKCFCLMYSRSRTFCPNFFCSAVYDNIVDNHRYQDPNWSNTDITKWGSSYLEVAKCFISSSGYKDKLTIQEVDCSGLLNIIINNTAFENTVTKVTYAFDPLPAFTKARDDRNTVFHSPNMELTVDQLKDMVDNMIGLLQLPEIIDNNGETKLCIEKLQKIRDDDIYISVRDEIEIQKETLETLEIKRIETLHEIEQSKQDLLDKVNDVKETCEMQMVKSNAKQQKTDVDIKTIEIELKTSCANLEKICEDLNHRQKETELSLTHLQTAVNKLALQHDAHDVKQDTIEKQIAEVCIEIPKVIEKHLLTKSAKEHEESMIAGVATNHRKKLEYLQRKDELQTKFCGYYKKCLSTIPVSPVLKTISGSVDEVFVELSICEDLSGNQSPEDTEQASFYRDVLFQNGTLCKSVYLLGNAGMGKTTWCKKVLNTWVKACDCSSKSNAFAADYEANLKSSGLAESTMQANEDTECLRQFDLLFYIALRQESQNVNITDMIKQHPVVKEYSLQTVVDEVLKYEPQTCLFLLDGLDEWTPQSDIETPSREGLHGCSVLTTSRPYRLVGIYDIDDTFYADRIVQMTGVRNKELLVKKVIQQLNNAMKKQLSAKELYDSSEKDYKNFIKDVKEMKDREMSYHKILPNYMDIPLMLIIMVCLWFDKGEFENTLTKNIGGMMEFIISYAEGFQRGVFRKKKVAAGKLEGIANLDELKQEWSKFAEYLPSQLRKKVRLKGYSELIFKVSYLAFKSLFNSEHRMRLTFSQEDLLQYFNEEELLVIVKIGILSQSEVTESPLCPMTKLSFIHKVFHEYLAGVYITIQFSLGKVEPVQILKDYFRDPVVYNLPDIDNAPCYVGGIDPIASSKMSVFLFKELTLDTYRKHSAYFNTFYLRQVQVVYENDENFPSEEYPIYTEYIYIPNNLAQEKTKYLHLLLDTNIKHLKCVEIPCNAAPEILAKFRYANIPDDLTLCIYDILPSVNNATLTSSLLCVPNLRKLELHGISNDFAKACERDSLDLTLLCLKELSLKELSNITILTKYPIQSVVCDNVTKCEIKLST
ncbi:uncharacterized protein LOC123525917 isoform X2 [Mercenaria mercenaria]|uniref:uncharacterized protein LOC123525917 isoform X2 n=1 Tax=Mercenaria mercenaria TaxID=6596 RepID=UPI00234E3FC0|nr:uncharacterized protein LOC123525917 isoform X2 [Mercenaria mercenaria]